MEQVELSTELKKIRARNAEVSSTTVLKSDTLRVVLMVLKAGARLAEHHTDGRLLLQTIEGEIEFESEGERHKLRAGMLASVGAQMPQAIAAVSDAVLLLTIVWIISPEAKPGAHRNVGYES